MALVTFTNLTAGTLGISKPFVSLAASGSPGDSKTVPVPASELLDNAEINTLKDEGKLTVSVADDPALADQLEVQTRTGGTLGASNPIVHDSNYSGTASFQNEASDLTLGAAAGKNHPDTAHLAPIMGNVLGDALTKTGNYIGGLIGKDSITGAQGTHYAKGGVVGIVADGVTESDGGVVSVLDGDGAAATPRAMFKAKKFNSNPGANPEFGLDLQDAAHDGYSELVPSKASLRLVKDVCTVVGTGAPTDAVTGAGVTGAGSLYIDSTSGAGAVYINVNTKASPTWKLVTHA